MNFLMFLVAGAMAASQPSSGAALTEQTAAPSRMPQILAAVRRAVGQRRLATMPNGFALVERGTEGAAAEQLTLFGTRRGELRQGDEFGFDGAYAWQRDGRRAMAVPSSQRQREKAMWPLWVRGHWWLAPASGIHASVIPAESDARSLALRLTLPDGLVPATLFIDRATWLPARLVVPYERGPFTMTFEDYRAEHGVMFAGTVTSSYRGEARRRLVALRPLDAAGAFPAPPLPADHRFDPARAAALESTAGAPFGPGSPGHNYVRAAADGRTGWWHFDSGSDSMIIDEAVADALGMEVIGTHRSMGADGNPREGTWRRGRSFTIGRLTIERPVFRAMDLSANNAPPGERRMGTIGYDLFARSVVEYARGGTSVRICDPRRYRLPRGGRWRRLEHIDATPAARGIVEGRLEGLFQVDTGTVGAIDFAQPFHERHRLMGGRSTEALRSQGSGGTYAVALGRLARFDFAGRRYDDLAVSFRTGGISREGSAGTIGRELLAPFTVVFDYANHRIAFVPLAAGGGDCG